MMYDNSGTIVWQISKNLATTNLFTAGGLGIYYNKEIEKDKFYRKLFTYIYYPSAYIVIATKIIWVQ